MAISIHKYGTHITEYMYMCTFAYSSTYMKHTLSFTCTDVVHFSLFHLYSLKMKLQHGKKTFDQLS